MFDLSTYQGTKATPIRTLATLKCFPMEVEDITMDVISGLPKTKKGFTVIQVIIDRLTKSTNFISKKITYSVDK